MANFLVIALLISIAACISAQDCAWDKDVDFPVSFPPLLIDKASWISLKPVMDNGKRIVKETEGASIVVACSGTTIASLGVEVAEGICSQGNILIGSQRYSISDLACTTTIKDSTNHLSGSCASNNIGTIAEIGFDVAGYPFYPIIQVCFEPTEEITIYTTHKIHGVSISAADGNPSRPSFKTDSTFYSNTNPNNCYGSTAQDDYTTQVTGNPDLIDLNSNNYFSRGHLSPNVDFITEMESDATFYYSNAVPQWQLYNGANWQYLESNCRDLANAHQVDLEITSGPWGLLKFKDSNGVSTEAYICDDQGFHVIPIPDSTWKVIYDPVLNQGVVVITTNIPYLTTVPTTVCPDIGCSTITWLSSSAAFDPTSFAKGYTYCCTVQSFSNVNPNAPSYPGAGLLVN